MSKKIVVTGATGQDGSYMIEYLLANTQDTIIAAIRRTSQAILSNLTAVLDNPRVKMVTLDLCDGEAIRKLIREEKPDYFINFGAQTFVADSWNHPVAHFNTNAISLIHILESVREYVPHCRVYSAGSSEQYGDVAYSPQDEKHPNRPRSIYGVSKVAAQQICKVYRESYGLYVVHGILFNHESERRQDYFVSRKIVKGVARIARAIKDGKPFEPLELGNLDAKRDWSHAEDFVDGVWRMLNQEYPAGVGILAPGQTTKEGWSSEEYNRRLLSKCLHEYILASGETHSVREFVEKAFAIADIEGEWVFDDGGDNPQPEQELFVVGVARVIEDTKDHLDFILVEDVAVRINPAFYRPAEVQLLQGDSSAARRELGWQPKVSFDQLVSRMMKAELKAVGLES